MLLRKWVPQSLDGVYDSVVQINFEIKCSHNHLGKHTDTFSTVFGYVLSKKHTILVK